MIQNLPNVVIFLQLLIWVNLYHYKKELPELTEEYYYVLGLVAFFEVYRRGFSVQYYSTTILMQYIAFTLASTAILRLRYGFNQAVSLAFLTVFLNSFWWELFYHVYEIQIWYPYNLNIQWWVARGMQWIRVIPFFFLRKNFKFKGLWSVQVGLIVSYIMARMRLIGNVGVWIMPLHRVVCLLVLIYVIMSSEQKTGKSINTQPA